MDADDDVPAAAAPVLELVPVLLLLPHPAAARAAVAATARLPARHLL